MLCADEHETGRSPQYTATAEASRKAEINLRMNYEDLAKTEPETSARSEHREGAVARSIEQQTAKLPSDWFLWAAVGSIAGSAAFKIAGKNDAALFVGQWAPTFLLLGIYNKLVKLHGSEGV
jgi:hypothetical protein